MGEISAENFVVYASCFVAGLMTGYKLKKPLQALPNIFFGEPTKLVLVVRDDLKMGRGKVISQCCHGTLSSYLKAEKKQPKLLRAWEFSGQPKVIVKVRSLEELLDIKKKASCLNISTCLIRDAGKTQIAPGTETVLSVGPDLQNNVDKVTGHLKLL